MFSKLQLEGNALLAAVTTLTCLGFLLIGYDNGLMGGFVNSPAFTGTLGIDTESDAGTNMIALVVAIYEIGCFIGAVTTSFIGEGLGRRRSVLIGVIILIIGLYHLHCISMSYSADSIKALCCKRLLTMYHICSWLA
jgi:MFS family permease